MTERRRPLIYVVARTPAETLGLTGPEKAILLALVSAMNYAANGYAVWPSSEVLAEWSGFSAKTAKRARERLRQLAIIKIEDDVGRVPVCIIQEHHIRGLADGSVDRVTESRVPRGNKPSAPSQRELEINQVVAGVAASKTTTPEKRSDELVRSNARDPEEQFRRAGSLGR